jgi:hypothetical protein
VQLLSEGSFAGNLYVSTVQNTGVGSFRLLYGASIDTLKLARDARTSPEMIGRLYAAPLICEMAIQGLQAKRRART